MSLATPAKLRKLQRALYATAKRDPARRFHVLYDKVWREDILAHAFALSRENGGAPGVDGVTFAQIEAYGVARWLGELREDVRTGHYTPQPVRRVMIPKSGGVGQRPLGIPTITAYCGTVQYGFGVPHRDAPVPPVGGPAVADPFHAASSDRSHLCL
ncbi:MAG TPA: hypothetical protein VK132_04080 [Gemmatimonadales bacterium]|nr:hypothetical protein [Gemmatimonadales bacterium]